MASLHPANRPRQPPSTHPPGRGARGKASYKRLPKLAAHFPANPPCRHGDCGPDGQQKNHGRQDVTSGDGGQMDHGDSRPLGELSDKATADHEKRGKLGAIAPFQPRLLGSAPWPGWHHKPWGQSVENVYLRGSILKGPGSHGFTAVRAAKCRPPEAASMRICRAGGVSGGLLLKSCVLTGGRG